MAPVEAFLARLYTDADARARFLQDPLGEGTRAGLDANTCQALARIDTIGLEMAACSYEHKRRGRAAGIKGFPSLWRRLLSRLRGAGV